VFVLDAFTGSLLRSFPNGATEAGAAPEASLSYVGQYVLSGGLLVWMVDFLFDGGCACCNQQ
jgi:hypothetical protein